MNSHELIAQAMEVRQRAYTPYSHYKVGAALLGKAGKVYLGCNIENAVYGLTCCAERTAVFKAVSEGETEFEAIAVATENGGPPWGPCRPVLNEFAPKLTVYIFHQNGNIPQNAVGCPIPDALWA